MSGAMSIGAGLGLDRLTGRGGMPVVPEYTGLIASGCLLPTNTSGANKALGTESWYRAAVPFNGIKLRYANWRAVGNNASVLAGVGNLNILVGVEYPAGVFTQVLWSTSANGVIASGTMGTSDTVPISGPAGAWLKVRTLAYWPTGFMLYNLQNMLWPNYRRSFATTLAGVPDYTMGGGQWDLPVAITDAYSFGPIAIIGLTTQPSMGIFGSSTPAGFVDASPPGFGIAGYLARAFSDAGFAVANWAVSGDYLATLRFNTTLLSLKQDVTHAATSSGTNDIYLAAKTSTQVLADYAGLIAGLSGKKIFPCLYQPRNTGSWSNAAGQIIDPTLEGHRVAVNSAIKAGLSGAAGYIDALAASERQTNPEDGIWKFDPVPTTGDGTHMLTDTHIAAAALVPVQAVMRA
ncbi:MAG: Lo5R7ANS 62 [Rhizobium sp.]|nr:Lo5R7ANS 62 [Rhizobium sp.]